MRPDESAATDRDRAILLIHWSVSQQRRPPLVGRTLGQEAELLQRPRSGATMAHTEFHGNPQRRIQLRQVDPDSMQEVRIE